MDLLTFKCMSENLATSAVPTKHVTSSCPLWTQVAATCLCCPQVREMSAHSSLDANKSPLGTSSHKFLHPWHWADNHTLWSLSLCVFTQHDNYGEVTIAAASSASASLGLGESHQTLGSGCKLAFWTENPRYVHFRALHSKKVHGYGFYCCSCFNTGMTPCQYRTWLRNKPQGSGVGLAFE